MSFFEEPQGAAVLKLSLLDAYAKPFTAKTGKWSEGNAVTLLDGYAGQGRYDDGTPGSPETFVRAARAFAGRRNVRCVFVEEDAYIFSRLQVVSAEMAADLPVAPRLIRGRIEEHLDYIVRDAGRGSLLALLDPFGLAVPFDQLTTTLLGRPQRMGAKRVVTEAIVNFSTVAVQRRAGRLDERYTSATAKLGRDSTIEGLDAFLGGAWWHEIQMLARPDERVRLILEGYLQRVCTAAPGWKTLCVPVSDRFNGPVAYYLVLLTRSDQGLWFFNNAASLGAKALDKHTRERESQLSLMEPDLEGSWEQRLADNIAGLLQRTGSVHLGRDIHHVYGDLIGLARDTHLRKALTALHRRGVIGTDPKGRELHNLVVAAPTPPTPEQKPAAARSLRGVA